jgi:glycosyltransferase involved in cell wall biosynthesis
MKVLLAIHEFFPESTGGAEVLLLDSAKMLRDRGHEVRILTARPVKTPVEDDKRFDTYEYDGLSVERFNHAVVPMGSQTNIFELEYNNLFFASYFRKFLKQWNPDVVHFFHLHRLSASAVDVCAELRVPCVYTATDFWPVCLLSQLRLPDNSTCSGPSRNASNCLRHLVMSFQPENIRSKVKKMPDWLLALVVRLIKSGAGKQFWFAPYVKALAERPEFMRKRMNMFDRILAPTILMKDILERHGVDRQRLRLQRFGINMQHYRLTTTPGSEQEKLHVGFIGALFEHKGAHLLIEAVRSLPSTIPLDVKIYGNPGQDPDYGDRLKAIAGDDARISFCGTFPNERIGEIFEKIDVLVVPSIWFENTPLVIYSALAAGRPVIATDLGGMSEVIKDRTNGMLFRKGDVPGLAKIIRLLADDRALLATLSDNTKPPKSIPQYVDELEACYDEVIKGKRVKT